MFNFVVVFRTSDPFNVFCFSLFCFVSFHYVFFSFLDSHFVFVSFKRLFFSLLVYYVFRIENPNIPMNEKSLENQRQVIFHIDFRLLGVNLGEGTEAYTYERWYLIWFQPNGLHIDYVKSVRWICADTVCDVYRILWHIVWSCCFIISIDIFNSNASN